MENIKLTPYFKTFRERIEDNTDTLKRLSATKSSQLKQSRIENVYFIDNDEDSLSQWIYPITINGEAFMDARPYMTSRNEINNNDMFTALENTALLELEWKNERERFINIDGNTSAIFGTWISQFLTRKYGMNVRDSFLAQIGFTAYYLSLFSMEEDVDKYWRSARMRIERYTLIPRDLIDEFEELTFEGANFLDIVKKSSQDELLDNICNFINGIITTPLTYLTPRFLGELVSFSWMGPTAAIGCINSLYHPVPFIEMLSRAVTHSAYNNKTDIGRTVKANRRAEVKSVADFVTTIRKSNLI